MTKIMNTPIPYAYTQEDIMKDFEKIGDKRKVAKIWGLSVKEITQILGKTTNTKKNNPPS